MSDMGLTLEKLTSAGGGGAMEVLDNLSACAPHQPPLNGSLLNQHLLAMHTLRYYAYGVIMPVICGVGIVGNLLNMLVLTRSNMKGIAYCYMRGYALSSLVALVVAVPFCLRMLLHGGTNVWDSYATAFYFARLELYLGNGFIGLSALLLVVLTVERYISVCHPVRAHNQTNEGPRMRIILTLLPICTFLFFAPYILRSYVASCTEEGDNPSTTYHIEENVAFTKSVYYFAYKWTLKIFYKIGPTIVIAYLNARIYWSYRRVCRRRRALLQVTREQRVQHMDEHRLMMLLVSTATLFFFCNLPMVVLSVSFSQSMAFSYPFQVFRAVSNVLELLNYSVTFYIYCLFTKEFRDTFLKTIRLREFSSHHTSKSSRTEV